MIYGLNFNNTQLPDAKAAFPEAVKMEAPRKERLRLVGMTDDADSVRTMMIVATNGKRILTTREAKHAGKTWWAVYAY